ncbi:DUF3530 family protein [Pseudomonas jilinensis]|uniref:DUF3530 domain-containing protein n=1 Tax=Pseudomonas jilinensis TaxID=2078689 RepID=A0A396S0M5_9PSED|nr:DUF3530 family protein [Pseudomonas jilinensis]RHW22289.1 hypothetical protein C2846_04510 [Pseudomonas jilinensis]
MAPLYRWSLLILLALGNMAQAGIPDEELDADELHPDAAPPAIQQLPSTTRGLQHEQDLMRQLPGEQQLNLNTTEQHWLGLWLPAARPEAHGAIVLVADRAEHADWPQLIGPARRQLSEAGWQTLAIALPDQPAEDFGLPQEQRLERQQAWRLLARERLQHSASHLREQGAEQVILLGRGEAAWLALQVGTEQADTFDALVLYRLRSPETGPTASTLIEGWDKPLLDIVPSSRAGDDRSARERRLTAQRLGYEHYQQLRPADPASMPQGQTMLIKRIDGWLQRSLPEGNTD